MPPLLRNLMQGILLTVVLLLAVMVTRAMGLKSSLVAVTAVEVEVDEEAVAQRLAKALRFVTVSPQDEKDFKAQPFEELREWLRVTYPKTYAHLNSEVFGQSVLLHWQGTQRDTPSVLLMSHFDVVPVEPGTESEWTYPAFDGTVADGYIWGRGALDVKSGVTAWHEAIEMLLTDGFQPPRDVYFSFGHDEEVGGHRGNLKIAQALEKRGVHLAFVIDEGGYLLEGLYPELGNRPVAVVSIAEKTYFTTKMEATGVGGHSSAPPAHTSVGKLATAMHRLEHDPLPTRLSSPMRAHFEALAPEMPFLKKLVFANLWITAPLVLSQMEASPKSNALARTTTACTIFHGGVKDNVVPQKAQGQVNFRILPGETVDQVRAHINKHIAGLDITLQDGLISTPPPPGRLDGPGFALISKSLREIIPDAVVTPFMLTGATDSRHFAPIADDIYRFIAVRIPLSDFSGVHGTDERVGISAYADAIRVAVRMLKNL